MIREITGDLLRDGKGVLCHQVNYQGVMGAGIAWAIREKLLTPSQYAEYVNLCMEKGAGLLDTVQFLDCGEVIVANMFCQNDFVIPDHPVLLLSGGTLTNYTAMRLCFEQVKHKALWAGVPVSIPGYIGCGIAGGDWRAVKKIIDGVFSTGPVEATIIYWEKERS